MRGLVMACVCVLALMPWSSAAAAKDAKALYVSGTKHYNLSEFQEALADFKEAYRLRPDRVFLYNIAQCHRRLGDPAQAAVFYKSFLRETPANAPDRVDVERLVLEMEQAVKAKEAEAQARVAEEERLRQVDFERQKELAEAAARANAPIVPVRTPDLVTAARMRKLKFAGIGVAAFGGLSLISGAGLFGASNAIASRYNGLTMPTPFVPADEVRVNALNAGGIALVAVGGALAVAGTVMALLGDRRERSARLAWTPVVGPSGTGLVVQGGW